MKKILFFLTAACFAATACGPLFAADRAAGKLASFPFEDGKRKSDAAPPFVDSFFNDLHVGALWFPGVSNKGYIGYAVLSAYYPGGGDQSALWQAGMWAGGYVEGNPLPWRFLGSDGWDSDPAQYDTNDEQTVVETEDDLGYPFPYRRLTVHVNTAAKPNSPFDPPYTDGDMGLDVKFEYHQWGVPGYDHWVFVHATVVFTKDVDDFWWGWLSDCDVGDVDVPDVYFDDYAGWDDAHKFCYMRDWDYDPLPGDTLWFSPNVIGQTLLAAPPAGGPVTAPPDPNQRWETKNYWDWNTDVSSIQNFYDRLTGAWSRAFPPPYPFDYRILNAVGPYDAAAGDTAQFWMAYVVGEGYDEDSHAMYGMGNLVDHVVDAHAFYNGGMVIPAGSIPPRAPDLDPDIENDLVGNNLSVHWAPYSNIASGASADSFVVYSSNTSKLGPWERIAAYDNSVGGTWVQLTPGICTYIWVQAWSSGNATGSNAYALSSRLYETDSEGVLRANEHTIVCVDPDPFSTVLFQNVHARAVGTNVEISWNVVVDEALRGFKIYRQEQGAGAGEVVCPSGLIPPVERSYVDGSIVPGKTYDYFLSAVREDGSEIRSQGVSVRTTAGKPILYQNHPNPFNPSTVISYYLPERVRLRLKVYNVEGGLIKTLVDGLESEGPKNVTWDGKDARGNPVGSGVYFYRLEAGREVQTKKMILLK